MVQINLLPDVKQEYLKSQQTKHTVLVGAVVASLVSIALLLLVFVYVQFIQSMHRSNLQKDIDAGVQELKSQKSAVKIVTVQGALEQLPKLQNNKPLTSSLFAYLQAFTPRDVSYNSVNMDVASKTITLEGGANTSERVNVFANNLKSARFSYSKDGTTQVISTPFTNVVFSALSKAEQSDQGKSVSFSITFNYDPIMFNEGISNKKLTVNASSEELILPTAKPFSDTAPTGGAQ
jgi:Tfp pilus assembly protein PilN